VVLVVLVVARLVVLLMMLVLAVLGLVMLVLVMFVFVVPIAHGLAHSPFAQEIGLAPVIIPPLIAPPVPATVVPINWVPLVVGGLRRGDECRREHDDGRRKNRYRRWHHDRDRDRGRNDHNLLRRSVVTRA
jgi:hypothetical protein